MRVALETLNLMDAQGASALHSRIDSYADTLYTLIYILHTTQYHYATQYHLRSITYAVSLRSITMQYHLRSITMQYHYAVSLCYAVSLTQQLLDSSKPLMLHQEKHSVCQENYQLQ